MLFVHFLHSNRLRQYNFKVKPKSNYEESITFCLKVTETIIRFCQFVSYKKTINKSCHICHHQSSSPFQFLAQVWLLVDYLLNTNTVRCCLRCSLFAFAMFSAQLLAATVDKFLAKFCSFRDSCPQRLPPRCVLGPNPVSWIQEPGV